MRDWADSIYEAGIPHNKFSIPLPDGTFYPDFILAHDERPVEFLRHFDRIRSKPWEECSFLDLGCSEGSTTMALSQTGSTVHGVEGRADGVRRGEAVRDALGLHKVQFHVENVNSPAAFRPVDGVFNAGILYHLDDPVTFMERTCAAAREFVLVDTGHAPDDDEELQRSKFLANFGRKYTLEYGEISLDVQDFAEPADPREKDDKGHRRGPRSGIGNTNSVWLTHAALVKLMAKLGFPYWERVFYMSQIPRHRTCFFRAQPRSLGPLALSHPLPDFLPRPEALKRSVDRDLAYLGRRAEPVTVVGREPIASAVRMRLVDAGIVVKETIVFPGSPGDKIPMKWVERDLSGKSGILITAEPEPVELVQAFVKLDRFSLALTSLGTFIHETETAKFGVSG